MGGLASRGSGRGREGTGGEGHRDQTRPGILGKLPDPT